MMMRFQTEIVGFVDLISLQVHKGHFSEFYRTLVGYIE